MSSDDRSKPDQTDPQAGGFLSRWARRKAEVQRQEQAPSEADTGAAVPVVDVEEEIDPATLPPIDSLTAESDFSLFLRKGVPPALKAAALRKLWLVEPSVVNYQPLVEYNWDFTAPGYGQLLPGDDIAKMAQQVFSGFSQTPRPADTPEFAPETSVESQQALPAPDEQPVAESMPADQPEPEPQPTAPRRRHGGALPS
jgi:hypothetical protein